MLVKITERKALNQLRDQTRQKRGGGRLRGESAFLDSSASAARAGLDQFAGPEPTPEFAAVIAEGFQRLLDLLADDELREIALLKLEGHTNEELAARTGRSVPTIERRLRLIRDKRAEQDYCCFSFPRGRSAHHRRKGRRSWEKESDPLFDR